MSSVLQQIQELEKQKTALLSKAKEEALTAANEAIAALNELGFNYRLVQGDTSTVTVQRTGTRRTGIRDQIFNLINQSTGMARQDVLKAMNATDKRDQQAVSNALAALKKEGKLTAENGVYTTV